MGKGNYILPVNALLKEGRYKLKKVIGQGGFGITYIAIDLVNNREVAIKELFIQGYCVRDLHTKTVHFQSAQEANQFSTFKDRFKREAEQLELLDHSHIVKIEDYFEENNTSYIIMEYIDGKNLYELIVKDKVNFSFSEIVKIIEQVGEALTYIHDKNMFHRDIKPSNIMLTSDRRRAVIIDFGNAKEFISNMSVSMNNSRILSPGYAPIEQYSQRSKISRRSEVYSLGASSYFLLTGKVPIDSVSRVVHDEFEDLLMENTDFSQELKTVVLKAMAIKDHDRYSTISEFINAISQAIPVEKEDGQTKILTTDPLTAPERDIVFFSDVFTQRSLLKDDSDDETETKLVYIGQAKDSNLQVLRILVNRRKKNEFQKLHKIEKEYYDKINFPTSELIQYDLGLGYYRPFIQAMTLRDYWLRNKSKFLRRNKLSKDGEGFVMTIFGKIIELNKWGILHGDLREDNILIQEKFGTLDVFFVDFPLLKMFSQDRQIDNILHQLIGIPFELFLKKLAKYKRKR